MTIEYIDSGATHVFNPICVKLATGVATGAPNDDTYFVDVDGGVGILNGVNGDDVFEEKDGMTIASGANGDDTFIISFGGDGDHFKGDRGIDAFMIVGEIEPITVDFGRFHHVGPTEEDVIIFSNPDVSDYSVTVTSTEFCDSIPPIEFGPLVLCYSPLVFPPLVPFTSTVTLVEENWEICRNEDNQCFSGTLPGIVRGNNPAGETIFGTSWNDRIHGNAGDDIIDGMCGSDQVNGNGGDDILIIDAACDRDETVWNDMTPGDLIRLKDGECELDVD